MAKLKTKKPVNKSKHRYNWRPDLPDFRDHAYAIMPPAKVKLPTAALPKKVDLRAKCSPIVNQGKIGSCTGNALAAAFEFFRAQRAKY